MTDRKRYVVAAAATLFILVAAFARLGSYPLIDPDETRYAQAAREMVARDDYVVPYLDGEPRINKPPLLYWSMIAAYKTFGRSESAARMPSALAGIAMIAATYLLARGMYGRVAGAVAAGALMSMPLFAGVSRLATTDCLLSAFLAWALYLWWRHATDGRRVFLWSAWAALAMAFLAKGPVAVALFVLITLTHALVTRRWSQVRSFYASPGALIFVAAALAWPIAVYCRMPNAISLWWRETGERFLVGVDHSGSLWFPAAVLAAGAFPWWLVPLGGARRLRALAEFLRTEPRAALLLSWPIVTVVFFTACRSQLATYMLPALPAIAVAAGGAVAGLRSSPVGKRALFAAAGATGVMCLALIGWAAWKGSLGYAAAGAAAAGVAATTFCFVLLYRRSGYAAAVFLAVIAGVTVPTLTPTVLGTVAEGRSFAPAVAQWESFLSQSEAILFAGAVRHSLSFYAPVPVGEVSGARGDCRGASAGQAHGARHPR